MDNKQTRIRRLILMGAGDESCEQCLDISIRDFSVCETCISETEAIISSTDATRYRWLKEYCFSQSTGELYFYGNIKSGDLDKAIDIAMKVGAGDTATEGHNV